MPGKVVTGDHWAQIIYYDWNTFELSGCSAWEKVSAATN